MFVLHDDMQEQPTLRRSGFCFLPRSWVGCLRVCVWDLFRTSEHRFLELNFVDPNDVIVYRYCPQ